MNSETRRTRATILEEAVEAALQADPNLAPSPIGVAVQGTTVSLTGAVGSEAAREKAEQLARHVGGVLDVVDELVVAHRDAGAWPFLGASLGPVCK
jgi:osmotically-inducible protein OsmY